MTTQKDLPREPAVARDDDEEKEVRREGYAGPQGQPLDTERPIAGEEEPYLRSHHLETSGGEGRKEEKKDEKSK